MKATLRHSRAIMGNDIQVSLEASGSEQLQLVRTTLDSFTLAEDQFDEPQSSFERDFSQAGDAAPDMDHELIVEATNTAGKTARWSARWTDPL
jgi:hypothetical protein